MAKKKKDGYPDIIPTLIIKRDVPFKNYKVDAVKVEFNTELIIKYFPYPLEDQIYGSDTKFNLTQDYELLETDAKNNLTAEDYFEYVSTPLICRKLYGWVELLLKEVEIDNAIYTGTICIGVLRFMSWHEMTEFLLPLQGERKITKRHLEFYDFMEKYSNGESEIKEIKIRLETDNNVKSKDLYMPEAVLQNLLQSFMYNLNTLGIYKKYSYWESLKRQCINELKFNPTTNYQKNKAIRQFTIGFDRLLKDEIKIGVSNKRYLIIGQILSHVGILPSSEQIKIEKLDRQYGSKEEYLADRVREYVRRGKK
jgi:hypothetical protein